MIGFDVVLPPKQKPGPRAVHHVPLSAGGENTMWILT